MSDAVPGLRSGSAADDIEILPEAGDSFFMSPSFTGGRPPTTNPPDLILTFKLIPPIPIPTLSPLLSESDKSMSRNLPKIDPQQVPFARQCMGEIVTICYGRRRFCAAANFVLFKKGIRRAEPG